MKIRPRVLLSILGLALLGAALCIGTSRRARVYFEARRLRSHDPAVVRAAYDHLMAIGRPWIDPVEPQLVATRLTLEPTEETRWFQGSGAAIDSRDLPLVGFHVEETLGAKPVRVGVKYVNNIPVNNIPLLLDPVPPDDDKGLFARVPGPILTAAQGKQLLVRVTREILWSGHGPQEPESWRYVVEDVEPLDPGTAAAMTEALRKRLAQLGR